MDKKFTTDNRCLECDSEMNVDITAGNYVCLNCGAIYDREEYQTYKMFNTSKPVNKNPGKPEKKTEEERKMPKEKVCKGCGKGVEAGKIWGGMHKACRKNKKTRTPAGATQTGIVGPDGVVIPVRLEITVSVKVEAK